jgi:mannose-6-phosphate isomerase-like protein (cupin superfamily)
MERVEPEGASGKFKSALFDRKKIVREDHMAETKTTHRNWIESQGIPILSEFSVPSLKDVKVGPWEKKGALGAFILLEGVEDVNDAHVLEIGPGGSCKAERHMYEEIFYVLSGRGATTVWNEGGPKRTFEWHDGSLFAMPLNAWHQFFNGQGDRPARFYVVSSAPLVMNLYHNLEFVFNNPFSFTDRFDGREQFFSAEGNEMPNRIWETNFVEDIRTFPLLEWKERGGGGVNRFFELADSTLTCHVSQFPVGTYKKGHRHGAGANVVIIQGKGYTLLWREGKDAERVRVDWQEASVLAPADMVFHQHFNTGPAPAKYLAMRWGSKKYPVFKNVGDRGKVDVSVKKGGNQIEYEDEDPYIRKLFEQELAKNGVESKMPAVKQTK